MTEGDEMRLDELAHASGVPTTTIRLYQNKGLVPGPRLVGRTGYYNPHHLARLRLIGRLQDDGFSLAGIGRILQSWETGRGLDELVGVEQELDALLSRRGVTLSPAELAERLPADATTPEAMRRGVALGLVELAEDGAVRVPDVRFLETGEALGELGVAAEVILDQWEALLTATDDIAERFIALFEEHLLPPDWRDTLDADAAAALAPTLARLRQLAGQVVATALDASIARLGGQRLESFLDESN
ncbi:MAG TPA: MerR family transcriptional regulator [Acidimicrobiales bacterium]